MLSAASCFRSIHCGSFRLTGVSPARPCRLGCRFPPTTRRAFEGCRQSAGQLGTIPNFSPGSAGRRSHIVSDKSAAAARRSGNRYQRVFGHDDEKSASRLNALIQLILAPSISATLARSPFFGGIPPEPAARADGSRPSDRGVLGQVPLEAIVGGSWVERSLARRDPGGFSGGVTELVIDAVPGEGARFTPVV